MGLLDCVASPEERDRFDESERPYQRPKELSRSDHDISRRRGLPLFASQTSLKNIRDVDFWRQRVVRYLYNPEGKEDIRVLRVPFNQLGFDSVTDFISDIPPELFKDYQNLPPPDEGLLKEYKVFWERDGIAEPGTFKWQGVIENENCFGLQLDRKKAVPYGIHDGKGLFYCKPGHRAIVPEFEVIPYKKFLRSFLGLPPKKDSFLELGDSVRRSASAIRAKNSKPGDRVYLPKEKKWATVQWIGKIGNETVVDLIYERPKPVAGQPVSPDEPCISRSLSMADFIGELESEPNTPIGLKAPKSPKDPATPPKSPQESSVPFPQPTTPQTGNETLQSLTAKDNFFPSSDEDDDDQTDDDSEDNSDSETDDDDDESENESGSDGGEEGDYNSDESEDEKVLPRTKEMDDVRKESEEKIEVLPEESESPNIPSPKRKGFFGFSPKNKKRAKSLPSVRKDETLNEKIKSETELREIEKPRAKSPNIFSNFRFKKNPKKKPEWHEEDIKPETGFDEDNHPTSTTNEILEEAVIVPPKKQKSKSSWTNLFKSKSKGSLSKLTIVQGSASPELEMPQTPIDTMVPPDKIPTPPPILEDDEKYSERRIERPTELEIPVKDEPQSLLTSNEVELKITKPTPPGPPKEAFEEASRQRGEVRLDSENPSESESSDVDTDDKGHDDANPKEVPTEVYVHKPPVSTTRSSSDASDGQGVVQSPKEENRKEDFPVYLAICPPYIPPAEDESDYDSPPPVPSSSPPNLPEFPPPPPRTPSPPVRTTSLGSSSSVPSTPLSPTRPVSKSPSKKVPTSPPPPPPPAPMSPQRKAPTPSPADTPAPQESSHSEVVETEPTQEKSPETGPTLNSVDRFKTSNVRNRPLSFGSFLARIKNQKKVPGEVIRYPDGDNSNASGENEKQGTPEPEVEAQPDSVSPAPSAEEANEETATVPTPMDSQANLSISRSLVKPNYAVPSGAIPADHEGDQEGIMLDLLEEATPPTSSPPPVPPTATPKSKERIFSFSFSRKRKSSQPQTPATPKPDPPPPPPPEDEEINNDNVENIEPSDNESKEKKPKSSSFRSSFKRTFSLTRKNKIQNQISVENDDITHTAPQSPMANDTISRPRPVTLYIDNNDVVPPKQKKNSFRNKRPASVVVDLKPWDMRHGTEGVDIYSSPSSDEAPRSPPMKSPNPALTPKEVEIVDIPKHRIFTTPAFFYKHKAKKSGSEPLIPKTKKTNYEKFNVLKDAEPEEGPKSPITPSRPKTPPPLPQSPPPAVVLKERPKSTAFEPSTPEGPRTVLKSALKQRKEIESIPKGLKMGDRVLWYSTQGPIPGTVQRLFKDGTDKYTAMVKFDRDVKDAPLRLVREGDAYIITVEELITPDMFEPKPVYANQEEIGLFQPQPETPITPSVRFNEVAGESLDKVESSEDEDEEEINLPPPFQEDEVQMACGFRRGIQSRDKSCCLESILFSLFYTTNAFDIAMLYGSSTGEDKLTKNVRKILRKEIVDPLRREGFVSCNAVKRLREAVKPLSEEWQTMSTDAEVMMFILFDRALKLGKFISYSSEMSDFLHQLVVDSKDLSKSTTIQYLFETSLQLMDKIKLTTVPTPALILEMPRSNDKLMQYKAVIPNLSLNASHLLHDGPRLCICGMVAKFDCSQCTKNVGRMSIVYCDNCKGTADIIHFQLPHQAQLSPLNQPVVILDLAAIICVKQGHYVSFVKCGKEKYSPWVYYDGAEIENPKVCIEQNLGMWLDRLEKYPGKYQDALQYPLLTHILQDSHICIYQPREKSSSV